VPAKGVFPDSLPWSANNDLEGYAYDPEKARELLAEAGISDTDGDGFLDYRGQPLNLTIKTYTKRAELKPSAEVVAVQLQSLGIKAQIEILESGALSADLKDGNYDLALYAWNTAPTGDPDYFLSKHFESTGSEAAFTGYSNPEVDEWIESGRTTFDPEERREYYNRVQEKVLADSPDIFLFYLNELVGLNTNVKGFEIYPSEVSFLTNKISLEA
jgi:peptide/nickel transport system substrate-binding protein